MTELGAVRVGTITETFKRNGFGCQTSSYELVLTATIDELIAIQDAFRVNTEVEAAS